MLLIVFVAVVCLFFYFVPSILANRRHHQHRVGIFLLNLLLGWSLIGWIIALVWSVSDGPNGRSAPPNRPAIQ
jgi:hypothetical protein